MTLYACPFFYNLSLIKVYSLFDICSLFEIAIRVKAKFQKLGTRKCKSLAHETAKAWHVKVKKLGTGNCKSLARINAKAWHA
jgi:hypothetical protein